MSLRIPRRPVVLVMEFVEGTTLERLKPDLAEKYFSVKSPLSGPILRQVGRIMALDVVCNNWDRIPLIHDNSGNFGNIMLQTHVEEGFLVAIDNAFTGIRKVSKFSRERKCFQMVLAEWRC